MVFISGGITHASFGGLGFAYYMGFAPLLGAAVFSVLAAWGILFLSENRKVREDSLIGIFWSAGMAIGVLFIYLTPGYAPNLMSYIFGNILTNSFGQIVLTILLFIFILVFFALFYRPLFYIAFDKEYSRTHHIRVNFLETGIMLIIALCVVFFFGFFGVCVVLCMYFAGIILVISYLTIPQAIAGMLYQNFRQQLLASALISTLGSVIGLFVSAGLKIPSGATIVLCFLLFFSFTWLVRRFKSRS